MTKETKENLKTHLIKFLFPWKLIDLKVINHYWYGKFEGFGNSWIRISKLIDNKFKQG